MKATKRIIQKIRFMQTFICSDSVFLYWTWEDNMGNIKKLHGEVEGNTNCSSSMVIPIMYASLLKYSKQNIYTIVICHICFVWR